MEAFSRTEWLMAAGVLVTFLGLVCSGVGYWMWRVVYQMAELKSLGEEFLRRFEQVENDHRNLADRVDTHETRLDHHGERLSSLETELGF